MLKQARRIVREGKGSPGKRWVVAGLHIALWPVFFLPRLVWPRRQRSNNVDRILLIRMDGIGDLAMSAAIFPALRRQFPAARIDLLTSNEAKGIADFFVKAGWLNTIHLMPLRGRSMAGYREMSCAFRALNYDVAIDLRGDMRNVLLMWRAGIPRRIGMPGTGLEYLLTDVVEVPRPHHQSEEPAALVRRIGVTQIDTIPQLPLGADDLRAAEQWLAENGIGAGRAIIAMHLGAFYPSKVWPIERFIEVAKYFQSRHGTQVLIVGGVSDSQLASEMVRAIGDAGTAIAAGRASLPLTAALLAKCALFIGNDSGPAHIAAGVGCPVVVLFGPANPVEYRPLGQNVIFIKSPNPCDPACGKVCVRGASHCMLEHSVQAVIDAGEQLIRLSTPTSPARSSHSD